MRTLHWKFDSQLGCSCLVLNLVVQVKWVRVFLIKLFRLGVVASDYLVCWVVLYDEDFGRRACW